jgi:hypothetical protein
LKGREGVNRIHASFVTSLCHLFYHSSESRRAFAYDIDFYRFLFNSLTISYSLITSNSCAIEEQKTYLTQAHQNLSIILFLFLFDNTLWSNFNSINDDYLQEAPFCLDKNIKPFLQLPFDLKDIRETLKSSKNLKNNDKFLELIRLKNVLIKDDINKKLRLFWNSIWHGCLNNLRDDLFFNQKLVQRPDDDKIRFEI